MGYLIEGRTLEACDCAAPCPCSAGAPPTKGAACDSCTVWQIDRGAIDGQDVAGLSLALLARSAGLLQAGGWRVLLAIDARANERQRQVLADAWTGTLGGPLADLAQLFGEVVGIEATPIAIADDGGGTHLRIGTIAAATLPLSALALDGLEVARLCAGPLASGTATVFQRSAAAGLAPLAVEGRAAFVGRFRFAATDDERPGLVPPARDLTDEQPPLGH